MSTTFQLYIEHVMQWNIQSSLTTQTQDIHKMYTQIVLVQTGKWIQLYKKKFFKLIEFLKTFWAIELIIEHKLTYETTCSDPFL